MGFAMCSILGKGNFDLIGFLIEFFSIGTSFFGILTINPTKFAITYTLGNLISLIG